MFIKIVPLCGYFLKFTVKKPLAVPFLFYSDLTVQVTRLNVFLILDFGLRFQDDLSQFLHNISLVILNHLVLQPY